MQSTIDLNEIEYLPIDSLVILKDNYGKKDYYSLCLKIKECISYIYDFKISFKVIDNIPICVLMLKLENKIYKCLIGFELEKEYSYLRNLMHLPSFNLFLMINNNEKKVIKINNIKNQKFIEALTEVKEITNHVTCNDLKNAKEKLIRLYSDEQLWNMDT